MLAIGSVSITLFLGIGTREHGHGAGAHYALWTRETAGRVIYRAYVRSAISGVVESLNAHVFGIRVI